MRSTAWFRGKATSRRCTEPTPGRSAAAAKDPEPVNTPSTPSATTYVLVHGAGHGGWCWRRVSDRLTASGHRVLTPTLSGLGERHHLLTERVSLDTFEA